MTCPNRFEVYTVVGAATAYNVPLSILEREIELGAIEVFRAAGARCVRAEDVQRLAEYIQGGADD